jgi:hypothetical protein
MVRLIVVLLSLVSFFAHSQTDYVIFKVRAGAFEGDTRKFDLKESHPVVMKIRISNDTMHITDFANSFYVFTETNIEQNTESLSVVSHKAVDDRGRKCTVFNRTSRTIEHSSIVVVYSNYIIQYFIARKEK